MTTKTGVPDGTPPPRAAAGRGRVVSAELAFDVEEPADIALSIAAARGPRVLVERLATTTTGEAPLVEPTELTAPHGGRIHLLHAPRGLLSVSYWAELEQAPAAPAASPGGDTVAHKDISPGLADAGGLTMEQLTYLWPSRYCPSDHVVGFAVAEFGGLPPGRPRVDAIAAWIHHRIGYVPGSSAVHDSAEDTLLTGQGVCRDFAHLGITLCRALLIPARFAAVYAPGLTPMDFHAVFEAWIDGAWRVYDATRKVPRASLVRIATGRDAADAAFADILGGIVTLQSIEVTATTAGDLPVDEHTSGALLS
ncbi:transglutaminase family protein [Pseudofrankia sp. BMG5.37]|uniref:transglutaminase-like domain-containing protein n=1 Tax=Pseudofrankia sp. BMG5.37 TaxID=3050035 RepID=UPI002895EF2A|nr:transglutaminase family protein [Pseudofrankia sp. BMG5.37]MDT3442392.1 transglutaminase family protein [Pseudofrankia sp. BMG5.37]